MTRINYRALCSRSFLMSAARFDRTDEHVRSLHRAPRETVSQGQSLKYIYLMDLI
jgi:hypothetical protein